MDNNDDGHNYVWPDQYDGHKDDPLAGYYTLNKSSTDSQAPWFEAEPEFKDDGEAEKVLDLDPIGYHNDALANVFGARTTFYA